jgi:hypothetical protein
MASQRSNTAHETAICKWRYVPEFSTSVQGHAANEGANVIFIYTWKIQCYYHVNRTRNKNAVSVILTEKILNVKTWLTDSKFLTSIITMSNFNIISNWLYIYNSNICCIACEDLTAVTQHRRLLRCNVVFWSNLLPPFSRKVCRQQLLPKCRYFGRDTG